MISTKFILDLSRPGNAQIGEALCHIERMTINVSMPYKVEKGEIIALTAPKEDYLIDNEWLTVDYMTFDIRLNILNVYLDEGEGVNNFETLSFDEKRNELLALGWEIEL